jgi:hypothetical protein
MSMAFLDRQNQKYEVTVIEISFFNYIFLRAIMVETGRYRYNEGDISLHSTFDPYEQF